jgi:CheY-like chemotaxis protein
MNRRVLAGVSDLFFASKIRGTAEQLNVTVEFARSAEIIFDKAKTEVPSLVILDLQAESPDPFDAAARLKADEQLSRVPIVAFFSHVEVELQRRAKEAGMDLVLPRSAFTNRLPAILTGAL